MVAAQRVSDFIARGRQAVALGMLQEMRQVVSTILDTGDVIGRDAEGRVLLCLAADDWMLDQLAAFDALTEGMEAEEPAPLDDGL